MNHLQTLKKQACKLRLSTLGTNLELRLQEATSNQLPHAQFLELLLQDELNGRASKAIARDTKAAAFREHRTLSDFDFMFGLGNTLGLQMAQRGGLPAALAHTADCPYFYMGPMMNLSGIHNEGTWEKLLAAHAELGQQEQMALTIAIEGRVKGVGRKWNLVPHWDNLVVHVGAHQGQEGATYRELGMENICWVEALPSAFSELVSRQSDGNAAFFNVRSVPQRLRPPFTLRIMRGQSSSLRKLKEQLREYPEVVFDETVTVSANHFLSGA